METRKVLPKNPSSIAAVASVLAGSKLLEKEMISTGRERCSDEELDKRRIFDGYFFSLGRWGDGEERRFGIDIGKAEKVS